MKKNTGIRKVVSVLACLTLTMSAMVSAFGLEVAPTEKEEKRDITSLTFGGCRTEAAEDGEINRYVYLDMNYTDESIDKQAVKDGITVTFSDNDSITSWEWDNTELLSSATGTRDPVTKVTTVKYAYTLILLIKQNTNSDFTVNVQTENGITANQKYLVSEDMEATPATNDTNTEEEVFPEPLIKGDVDGNGRITANDSLMITRHNVKLITLTDQKLLAADVNNDSKVDSKDAIAVLRYTIGYDAQIK